MYVSCAFSVCVQHCQQCSQGHMLSGMCSMPRKAAGALAPLSLCQSAACKWQQPSLACVQGKHRPQSDAHMRLVACALEQAILDSCMHSTIVCACQRNRMHDPWLRATSQLRATGSERSRSVKPAGSLSNTGRCHAKRARSCKGETSLQKGTNDWFSCKLSMPDVHCYSHARAFNSVAHRIRMGVSGTAGKRACDSQWCSGCDRPACKS